MEKKSPIDGILEKTKSLKLGSKGRRNALTGNDVPMEVLRLHSAPIYEYDRGVTPTEAMSSSMENPRGEVEPGEDKDKIDKDAPAPIETKIPRPQTLKFKTREEMLFDFQCLRKVKKETAPPKVQGSGKEPMKPPEKKDKKYKETIV